MFAVHECLRVGNPCFICNGLFHCCDLTDLVVKDFSGLLFSANDLTVKRKTICISADVNRGIVQ